MCFLKLIQKVHFPSKGHGNHVIQENSPDELTSLIEEQEIAQISRQKPAEVKIRLLHEYFLLILGLEVQPSHPKPQQCYLLPEQSITESRSEMCKPVVVGIVDSSKAVSDGKEQMRTFALDCVTGRVETREEEGPEFFDISNAFGGFCRFDNTPTLTQR
ncbi:hypothetical protein BLNAU_9077 [Blattamonas nauphoetae]|uniref:Uncharacterized protein n=1 Tax=Blattamonas nauphoetae TaxID=2049346 RepID=A0ABQ9XWQ5_9EUKA|nr:hypothetical protein BLNAU_9077 [Blattamonas nauphoetae]